MDDGIWLRLLTMVDILESNLFNPTAPREVIIPKRKKNKTNTLQPRGTTILDMEGNHNQGSTPVMSEVLDKLLNYLNIHVKKYSSLDEQNDSSEDQIEKIIENTEAEKPIHDTFGDNLGVESLQSLDHAQEMEEYVSSAHYKYHSPKNAQNVKMKTLIRLYLAIKGRILRGKESDEDQLVNDDEEDIPSKKLKAKEVKNQLKTFAKRKRVACKTAYTTTKRIFETKRKKATKSLKKGVLEWAYGIANMTPYIFAHAGLASVNEFQYDSSYITNSRIRSFC